MNLNGEKGKEEQNKAENTAKQEQNGGTRWAGRTEWKTVDSKSEVQLFENSNWLKTNEAAEYLRTGPKQIRKWVYQGKIKAYKLFDKSLRFKRSELDLLMKGVRSWV